LDRSSVTRVAFKTILLTLLPLLVVYVVWGTTMGAMRLSVDTLPWALVPCIRFLTAGFLLMLVCLARREPLPSWREVGKHAIAGLLLFTGGNSIVCWVVQYISTGLGGLVVSTLPFWILALSALLPPRERITRGTLISILISFSGMIVLLLPHLQNPTKTSPLFWWSLLVMLINTIFWALGSVYIRKHPSGISRCMTVSIQTFSSGLSLIPVCLLTIPAGTVLQPSIISTYALIYLILFGTGLATPCYLYIVKNMPLSISSTFAYVTPVMTIIFGYLFLKEDLNVTTIFGIVIILSGVIIAQILSLRATHQKETTIALINSTPLEISTSKILSIH
jgi:drug/metabolite transporter (DMT)-like permease